MWQYAFWVAKKVTTDPMGEFAVDPHEWNEEDFMCYAPHSSQRKKAKITEEILSLHENILKNSE